MRTTADILRQRAWSRNPHALETVADAYAAGIADAAEFVAFYRPQSPLLRSELREACRNWRASQFDHGDTSYFGAVNIRKSRAYFLAVRRAARAIGGRA